MLGDENILKIDLGKNPRLFPTWQNPYVWYAYSRYDSYVKRYLMISGGSRAVGYKEAEAMVSPLADMVNLWAALCANGHQASWEQSINNATIGGVLDYISQTRKMGKIL